MAPEYNGDHIFPISSQKPNGRAIGISRSLSTACLNPFLLSPDCQPHHHPVGLCECLHLGESQAAACHRKRWASHLASVNGSPGAAHELALPRPPGTPVGPWEPPNERALSLPSSTFSLFPSPQESAPASHPWDAGKQRLWFKCCFAT